MPANKRSRHVTRRTFIKTSAATGAALAAGPVFAPAVHAQARPIKLGYVSPADRAARALRGGRRVHAATVPRGDQGRAQGRQRHAPDRGALARQPVQSEPRRRGRQGPDRPRQGRSHAGRQHAGDHQSGLHPGGDRRGRHRLLPGALAAVVHRPAGQPGRRAAGVEAVQLRLPLLLGPRGRDRGVPQHVGPARHEQGRSARCSRTTATATPGATRKWASRPCSPSRASS